MRMIKNALTLVVVLSISAMGMEKGEEESPIFTYKEWAKRSDAHIKEHGYTDIKCCGEYRTIDEEERLVTTVLFEKSVEDKKEYSFLNVTFDKKAPTIISIVDPLRESIQKRMEQTDAREFYRLHEHALPCFVNVDEHFFGAPCSVKEKNGAAFRSKKTAEDRYCVELLGAHTLCTKWFLKSIFFKKKMTKDNRFVCGRMRYDVGQLTNYNDTAFDLLFTFDRDYAQQKWGVESEGDCTFSAKETNWADDGTISWRVGWKGIKKDIQTQGMPTVENLFSLIREIFKKD